MEKRIDKGCSVEKEFMMKILMITSEITPYAKVGGLADVVSSFGKEFAQRGHDVCIVCPLYGFIEVSDQWQKREEDLLVKLAEGEEEVCGVWEVDNSVGEMRLYFVENEKYFGGDGIYGSEDEDNEKVGRRFVFLSRCGIEFCRYLDWIADVIHCHDWMTSVVPVCLKTLEKDTELGQISTVLTLHNMEHQGVFDRGILDFAGLPQFLGEEEELGFGGSINLLKGGIKYATQLTTVSERYAQEIVETDLSYGLGDILKGRREDLRGIINGIDTEIWNPGTDRYLPVNFTVEDRSGKKVCKQMLQKHFNLEQEAQVPIFAVIARLYWQKGLDLLLEIIPELMEKLAIQIVILGSGDKAWEKEFKVLAERYVGRMGVSIGHNSRLPHLIEGGSDFFLMPSRFEPCGLNQMYSMVYGSVPIVRRTGGLVDTVDGYVPGNANATGFIFEEISSKALNEAIHNSCDIYYHNIGIYELMQTNGMKKDFSWKKSIKQYEVVYSLAMRTVNL